MILPDVKGFVRAVECSLGEHEVVYVHGESGDLIAAIVRPDIWNNPDRYEGDHDHIEASAEEEASWLRNEI